MEFTSIEANPSKPFYLMPLGDLQWTGDRGVTAIDLLKRRIDVGLRLGAKFVGLGDYIDFMSPSNRKAYEAMHKYDSTEDAIEDTALNLVLDLYHKILKPTKGHWLGLLEGHHFMEMQDGTTTDQRLAGLLETDFLGSCAMGRINFKGLGDVIFWAHHGRGSGQLVSAPLNRLERLANYWQADIFLMGHMTKMPTAPIERVFASWSGSLPHLRYRKIMLVGCGGFSKGYMERSKRGRVPRGSYVEAGMLAPTSLGNPLIKIEPLQPRRETAPGVYQKIFEPNITVEI